MKEFTDQVMKFKITEDKLKMEIKLTDLARLLKDSPSNVADDGELEYCHVRKGKNKEFAERIVEMLMDESPHDENNIRWGQVFEDIFVEMMEGDEDCLKYRGYN